jgi:hypothetical protein
MLKNTSDNIIPSKKELGWQLIKLTFSAVLFGVIMIILLIKFSWLNAIGGVAAGYAIWHSFRQAYLSNTPR